MDFHYFYVYYDGETYYHKLHGLSYQGSNQKQKCVKVKHRISLRKLQRRILTATGLDHSRHNMPFWIKLEMSTLTQYHYSLIKACREHRRWV